jgi:hypothetical protein
LQKEDRGVAGLAGRHLRAALVDAHDARVADHHLGLAAGEGDVDRLAIERVAHVAFHAAEQRGDERLFRAGIGKFERFADELGALGGRALFAGVQHPRIGLHGHR